MNQHNSYMQLFRPYLAMIITSILIFGYITTISSESIPNQAMSSILQDLSLKILEYKSDDRIIESHPLNEGFILLADNSNNPPHIKTKSSSPSVDNRKHIFHNISSTTCKTVTKVKTVDRNSLPNVDPPLGHVGRRLLNEPSYDTDIETATIQTPADDDSEIESFLKVDEEEMHRRLINLEVTGYISGDTSEPTSEMTTISLEPITILPITTESETLSTETLITSEAPLTTTLPTSVTRSTAAMTTSVTPSTTITTTPPERIVLSSNTTFIITLDCANASITLNETLEQFDTRFKPNFYNITYDKNALQCNDSEKFNLSFNIFTDNQGRPEVPKAGGAQQKIFENFPKKDFGEQKKQKFFRSRGGVTPHAPPARYAPADNSAKILTDLIWAMEDATEFTGIPLYIDDICGNNGGIVLVTNVTSCYLIKLCHLCGRNPRRGECYPETNLIECRCFVNIDDPSNPYETEFCYTPDPKPQKSINFPSRWTPIIVGILAGLTALFFAITFCLWAVAVWRRRITNPDKDGLRIPRIWHLPRAAFPTTVTAENAPNPLEPTISNSSTNRTNSDNTDSNTTDSTFFKELDQKMGEKLRATITRPNTGPMLASLPADSVSTLSSYDPIDELDAIIDHEDLNTTFHDPLDELYDDNEMLEVMNPNLKLPRPNVDSKPTGLFAFF